jgi:hypothetical protein
LQKIAQFIAFFLSRPNKLKPCGDRGQQQKDAASSPVLSGTNLFRVSTVIEHVQSEKLLTLSAIASKQKMS